jgi:sec-independent protein translocase protein TatA
MFGLRAPELLIILLVVLVLFGGQRVPQLGAALGQAIRNFKKGFNGDELPNGTPAPAPATQQNSTKKDA